MQIRQIFTFPAEIETEALVVFVAEREPKLAGLAADVDQALGGAIAGLLKNGEFSARANESLLLFKPAGIKAKRLLLVGAGKAPVGIFELRRLAGAAARALKSRNILQAAVIAPADMAPEAALGAIVTGAMAADFEPGRYKSERDEKRMAEVAAVFPPPAKTLEKELSRAAEIARAIGEGQEFARELANEPSNRLTPTLLAERAQAMAKAAGLECDLIDAARARELKMGAFLSVAQGSAEPPVMIVLQYRGGGAANRKLALVGKGITFDTGGISIKPADGMEKMKYDMAGGAAVLGAMQAIAALRPKLDVLAIVPATENMPGGRAQKPGDVQIAMSGKSIEVLNTDAEGRLVLADGLAYARQLGATHLVDVATLTGAVAIALGAVHTGVFANDESFYADFERARQSAGEKMWRLPLDDEYFEQIRGTVGDILNTGGRYGGAITAAMFLREFADSAPWIHLDIAGTAWLDDAKPWLAKGPTGAALPTLVNLALAMASR
ncbi:MAG: leucyl aminopeptidase [Terriglobales bacterium]